MAPAANTVRDEVNTLLINERDKPQTTIKVNEAGVAQQKSAVKTPQPSKPANTSTQNPNPSNLDIIKAATAVYRSQNAPEGKPYNTTDEQKTIFENAQKNLAERKGIFPDEDGSFREEHLANELSPLEVIKQFSFDHYKDIQDNDTAFKDIEIAFKEIYDNEKEDQKEPVPEQLSSLNSSLQSKTFYTDADFLALKPKEQQEYLESIKDFGAEVDRLTKLLEENANNNKKHEAPLLKNEKDDVDAPHLGGKDYKTDQKDIIEWMMKEIILAGLDWIGNRTIEFVTNPIYNFGYKVYKNFKTYKREHKENKEKKETNTPETPANNPDENQKEPITLKQIIENSKRFADELKKELKETIREKHDFRAKLIIHEIVPDKDGFIKDGKKYPYQQDNIYKNLLDLSEKYDEATLKALTKKLNINDDDEKAKTGLTEWFNNTVENIERKAKGEKEKEIKIPESLQEKGLTQDILANALKETNEDTVFQENCSVMKETITKSAELFAINYATYKLIEESRKAKTDEERKALETPESLKERHLKHMKEGQLLMYQNYQNLRNKNEAAISTEEMIQLSDEMVKTSIHLYENNDNSTESPNLIEERISPTKNQNEVQTLIEFGNKIGINDALKIEFQDLYILQKEKDSLTAQNQDVDDRRKLLNELKKERTQTNIEQRENIAQKTSDILNKKTNQHE